MNCVQDLSVVNDAQLTRVEWFGEWGTLKWGLPKHWKYVDVSNGVWLTVLFGSIMDTSYTDYIH